MKKNIVFGLLLLCACFALAGCGCSKKEFTVSFNSNGGSSVSSQSVKDGQSASKPTDPSKDGYTFVGWFLDLDDADAFDFNSKITKDITLFAKWADGEPSSGETCSKTCKDGYSLDSDKCECVKNDDKDSDTNTDSVAVKSVSVDKTSVSLVAGDKTSIKASINPSNASNKSLTWSSSNPKVASVDKNGNITAVAAGTATITVKAANGKSATIKVSVAAKENKPSTSNTYTVTFDSVGGSKVASQSVKDGDKAVRPADPTKDGYTFDGWLLDGKAYDFNSKVTKAITLTAKWVEAKYTFEVLDDGDPMSYMYNVRVYEGSKDITASVTGIFGTSESDLLGTYSASMGAIRIPKASSDKISQIYYNEAYHKVTKKN